MNQIFTADTFGELSRQIETFVEEHDVFDYDSVTIVTEKVGDDTPAGYHWKATLMPKYTDSALKDLLVEEHGYVDFFVSSEEIRAVATDMQRELSDEEVASVVDFLSHNDLEIGLCEGAISGAISEICPDATDQDWDEDSDLCEESEEDDNGIEYLRSIGK